MTNKPLALVTGSNRGIGFAVVKELLKLGYSTILKSIAQTTPVAQDTGIEIRRYPIESLQMYISSFAGSRSAVMISTELVLSCPYHSGVKTSSMSSGTNRGFGAGFWIQDSTCGEI